MAGTCDSRLSSEIETLRNDLLKAGVLNAKALQDSAESHVANLGRVLPPSPDLDDAFFQVMTSVIAFARLLYGQAQIAEAETARRQALARLDRLARIVAATKPVKIGGDPSGERRPDDLTDTLTIVLVDER